MKSSYSLYCYNRLDRDLRARGRGFILSNNSDFLYLECGKYLKNAKLDDKEVSCVTQGIYSLVR